MTERIYSREMQIEPIAIPSEDFVKDLIERYELNAYEMVMPVKYGYGDSWFGLPSVQKDKAKIYGGILEDVLTELGQGKIINKIRDVAEARVQREIEEWKSRHGVL